jgi:hypothetical protein
VSGASHPRPEVVDDYRRIDNLSEWCDRRLFAVHRGRYSHLTDREFWPLFRDSLRQWAVEQAEPTYGTAEGTAHRWVPGRRTNRWPTSRPYEGAA